MIGLCRCLEPVPYERPSGVVICARLSCGGLIPLPPVPKVEKP